MLCEPIVIVFLSVSQKLENTSQEFREAGCKVGNIGQGLENTGQKSGTASQASFLKAKKLSLSKVILEAFMTLFWIESYSLHILVVLYM